MRERHHHYKSIDIKRIIREYYKQLYADTSDNIGEMDKVLKRLK